MDLKTDGTAKTSVTLALAAERDRQRGRQKMKKGGKRGEKTLGIIDVRICHSSDESISNQRAKRASSCESTA
jgi:hypothetical protein